MTESTEVAPAPFDFDALDLAAAADQPFEFELLHPISRDGLGVFLSVVGAESATFQGYLRGEGNRARKRAFEAQRKGANADKPRTVEEDEDTALRALAACVVGWRTVIDGTSEAVIVVGGKKLQFGADNVLFWLRKFRWVREQVNDATGELGNFIRG